MNSRECFQIERWSIESHYGVFEELSGSRTFSLV
jgi:hypothetical protein